MSKNASFQSGRRRFMGRLGASALGTSAVVFGFGADPASASAPGSCCNIDNSNPPNWNACVGGANNYIWWCNGVHLPGVGRAHCQCCESWGDKEPGQGPIVASGENCHYH